MALSLAEALVWAEDYSARWQVVAVVFHLPDFPKDDDSDGYVFVDRKIWPRVRREAIAGEFDVTALFDCGSLIDDRSG